MKKMLFLAVIALTMQSCLKDKESDILKGVGAETLQVSFDAPYGTLVQKVETIRTENLSYASIVRKRGVSFIKIPVVVTPRASTKDIVINIKNDDITRVPAYNLANGLSVSAGPDFMPFVPMPAGKFTIPSSVTIKAGQTTAYIVISVPDVIADYDFYEPHYMIALTLSSTDAPVYNPSTILGLSMQNPYSGTFRYTGTAFTENTLGVKGVNVFTMDKIFTANTLSETESSFSVGYPNNPLRALYFNFNQLASCTDGICPDGTLTLTGSANATLPSLYGTTPPVLSFDANGRLMSIKGIKYQWRQLAGPPAVFYKQEVDIVRVGE